MGSLHRHLQLQGPDHDQLAFRPDCPTCQTRLTGRYPEARPFSTRQGAAATAGLAASWALLPAGGALAAGKPDRLPVPTPAPPPAVVTDDQGRADNPPLEDRGGPAPSTVPAAPAPAPAPRSEVEIEVPRVEVQVPLPEPSQPASEPAEPPPKPAEPAPKEQAPAPAPPRARTGAVRAAGARTGAAGARTAGAHAQAPGARGREPGPVLRARLRAAERNLRAPVDRGAADFPRRR